MPIRNSGKILLVDDSGTMRGIVRKMLAQLGFANVDEAADGAAALIKLNEHDYELVISDWNMEPMNGHALLERVRSNQRLENLPFIMMTAETDEDKLIEAKFAGVSSFISKPFDAETLKAKIAKID
jgi:two-component system chemotaxis response regulator CheY